MSTEFDRLYQQMKGTDEALNSPGVPSPFDQMGATPPPTPPQDPSLLDRFSESAANRGSSIADTIMDATGQGQAQNALIDDNYEPMYDSLSWGQAGVQLMGDTLGFVWDAGGDVITEAVTEAWELVPEATQEATKEQFRELMNSDVGQMGVAAIQAGFDAWDGFANRYPQEAKTIAAAFNITPVGQVSKVRKMFPTELTPLRVKDVGVRKILQAPQGRDRDVYNIITPELTKEQKLEQIKQGNVTNPQGPSGTQHTILSDKDWDVVDAVKPLDVSPANTQQTNTNNILKEINKLGQQTQRKTANAKGGINKDVVVRDIMQELDILRTQKPGIFGRGGKKGKKTVEDLLSQLDVFLNKHGTDFNGILNARQDFDNFLIHELKAGTFGNSRKASVAQEVHRAVRDILNGYVRNNVPGTADLLDKQHLLYTALDGVAPKAIDEASSAIGRVFQLFNVHLPTTPASQVMTFTDRAVMAAMGLGAVVGMPFVLGWRGLGKPIAYSSPVRQSVGYTKQAVKDFYNEAVKLGKYIKDPEVLKAYRADLKVIASMIHTWNGEEEQTEEQ